MVKMHLKTGDSVEVISGSFCGLIDDISRIEPKKNLVYLKKATRKQYDKSPGNKKKSELKEIIFPIHVSNVRLWEEAKDKKLSSFPKKTQKKQSSVVVNQTSAKEKNKI